MTAEHPTDPPASPLFVDKLLGQEHWMKDLYLNPERHKPHVLYEVPEPRDPAAIRADLMAAEKLEHDPDVVHEEGSWGAAGCPRCDAMEPLSNELLRSTLRGPSAP
ncbi:hypothetical protein SEA_LYMARA_97 [Arthrobacter phage Lymara]|uniref:Uncharacterized protein n=1 Tax=Arthrobacter phage Lymara TaxID=2599828 RepID=A0A5J6TX58_9CAUD|nr:hypothetical protein HYQ01_gp097 [Arthrobacter phage Lymara]QFG14898.1 hypothetical protein SEA_LYMARA_97 [Arthrobacter phage Lymara]